MKLLQKADFCPAASYPQTELVTLRNPNGLVAQFTNHGARWVSMWTPDKSGNRGDILLGFDTLSGYCEAGEKYHGAIVGRVCGRMNRARFALNGIEYQLASNDSYGSPVPNHLHGGFSGFHTRLWDTKIHKDAEGNEAVTFSYFSPDGEEGYPGNLMTQVTYVLTHTDILRIDYKATTDRSTPVNLTNHAFFNLSANPGQPVLNQTLQLQVSAIIECDKELIPTGRLLACNDTAIFFRQPHPIRHALREKHSQIQYGIGFSTAYVLTKGDKQLSLAARIEEEASGRVMEVFTDLPSLQVYTAYFMDGTDRGKNRIPLHASAGIALETQGFPDAPNQPHFPSIVISPEKPYTSRTEYKFSNTGLKDKS